MGKTAVVRLLGPVLCTWFIALAHAHAQVIDPGSSPILALHPFTAISSEAGNRLPAHFELLVWNIQKVSHPEMIGDFADLAKSAEIVLFQEAIDTPSWIDRLHEAKDQFGWSLAQSFQSDWLGYSTGVATGSRVPPIRLRAALSPVQEPVTMTPKSILVSEYALVDRTETLLVANVHAINFREQNAFESHMNQLVELMRGHLGPMIVAGDFNTWNSARQEYLIKSMRSLGLYEVPLNRTGFLILDHVFVRGVQARETQSHFDVKTSDHFPMTVDVRLAN